ncbi:MAG: DUF2378 family protein [Myxococcaceae bacterium]
MNPAQPRVVFGAAFDSLFSKEVRARLTPALRDELKKLNIDLERRFNPGYPVETWAATVGACAKHLFPDARGNESWFELGRLTMRGFGETVLGRAAFGLMKLIGPARTLERSARTYASVSNYTVVTLKRLDQTVYTMHLTELHTPPEYDMGVVDQALELLGVLPEVKLEATDPTGFTLRVSWQLRK